MSCILRIGSKARQAHLQPEDTLKSHNPTYTSSKVSAMRARWHSDKGLVSKIKPLCTATKIRPGILAFDPGP